MEQVKKDWELTRLKQLKEEEERKAELEEDEMLYSYSKSEVGGNNNTNRRGASGGGGGENNASKKPSTNSKKLVPNHSHMLRKKSIRLAGGSTSTSAHHHAHQKSLQLKKSKAFLNVKKKSATAASRINIKNRRTSSSVTTSGTAASSRFTASLLDSEVQRFNKKQEQDQVFGKKNLFKKSSNSPQTNPSSRSNTTNPTNASTLDSTTSPQLAEKENKRQFARKKPRSLSPQDDNKTSCDTTINNEDGSPVLKEAKKIKKPRAMNKKLAKMMDSASFLQDFNKSNDLKLHHNTLNSSSDYSDDEQHKPTSFQSQDGEATTTMAADTAEVVKKKKKRVKEIDPNKPKLKRGRKPKYLNPDGTSVASTNKNSISQLLESSNLQRLQLTSNSATKIKKPKSNKTSPDTSINVVTTSTTVATAPTVSPPQALFNPVPFLFTQTQQPVLNEKPKILHLTPVMRNPMPNQPASNPTVIKTIVKQVHSNVGNMVSSIPTSNIKSNLNIPNISLPTQNRPPVVTIRNLGMSGNPVVSAQPKQILITKPLSATSLPTSSSIATPVATSLQILAPTASSTTFSPAVNPSKLVYKSNTSPSKKPLTISAITAAQQAAAAAAASSSSSIVTQSVVPQVVTTQTATAAPILMLNPVGHVSLVKPSISDTGLILNTNVNVAPRPMQLVQNPTNTQPGMMMSNLEEQSKLIKQYLGQNFGDK